MRLSVSQKSNYHIQIRTSVLLSKIYIMMSFRDWWTRLYSENYTLSYISDLQSKIMKVFDFTHCASGYKAFTLWSSASLSNVIMETSFFAAYFSMDDCLQGLA